MVQAAILVFGFINILLAILSVRIITLNDKKVTFIWWWCFLSGAFVWEDILVFGTLHFVFSIVSIYFNNPIIWLVYYIVFWIVRSAGETLYFFLQQFIEPKQYPHYITSHFLPLRKVLGNISDQKCFIVLQVSMQSILVISIFALIFVLKQLI